MFAVLSFIKGGVVGGGVQQLEVAVSLGLEFLTIHRRFGAVFYVLHSITSWHFVLEGGTLHCCEEPSFWDNRHQLPLALFLITVVFILLLHSL